MRQRLEANAVEALRFFRALPKSSTSKTPLWVSRTASGLVAGTRSGADAVRITGSTRLRVLQPLLPKARALRVYADAEQQSSAWVLDFGDSRLTLALSAEVWRGFSGEGQALWALMQAKTEEVASAMRRVRAQLQWQPALDAQALADELGLPPPAVADSLRVLGASGLAGYDVSTGHYFHRVLPFDLSAIDDMHPRLADARALLKPRPRRWSAPRRSKQPCPAAAWCTACARSTARCAAPAPGSQSTAAIAGRASTHWQQRRWEA